MFLMYLSIMFCRGWAGNSYVTSGCLGTCAERLQDPKNFEVGGVRLLGYLVGVELGKFDPPLWHAPYGRIV